MASPKLLVGATVTVGTVSTAGVVVANQYGLFSTIGQATKESVEEWIKTKSNNRATLKLLVGENEEEKTLEEIKSNKKDLQKLFGCLKKNEGKFSKLTSPTTLVFKKVNEEWKHIQKFIEDWVEEKSGSLSALKTKEGGTNKPLSYWSDRDLELLFNFLERHEKLFMAWKNDNGANKSSLELKKGKRDWELMASQTAIEIWIKANSNSTATLKLFESNVEKNLSEITVQEDLEKILGYLKTHFNDVEEEFNNKTLVFEKTDDGWKHVRAALIDWMNKNAKGKFIVQIKKSNSEVSMYKADDNDLIGLFKHLKDSGSTYASKWSSGRPITKKLQKKASSSSHEWEEVTGGA